MVTGQKPFKGDYDKAVMYSILSKEPEPITALRTGVPMELEVFVGKCLAKEAKDRYDSAAEIAKDLRSLGEKLKSGRATTLTSAPAATPSDELVPRRKLRLALALAAGLAIAFAAASLLYFTEEARIERPVRKWSFTPEALSIRPYSERATLSPNGRHIAYVDGPGSGPAGAGVLCGLAIG